MNIVSKNIRARRSVYPVSYIPKAIDEKVLFEILENANYAPTHKLTQPWRFRILSENKKRELGVLMADHYRSQNNGTSFSEIKYNKKRINPTKSTVLISICMKRDPKEQIPEWEEVAATAMAVQNMWLTASQYGLGAYWSSPSFINTESCKKFLLLEERERCLGFFYLGHHESEGGICRRDPVSEKILYL